MCDCAPFISPCEILIFIFNFQHSSHAARIQRCARIHWMRVYCVCVLTELFFFCFVLFSVSSRAHLTSLALCLICGNACVCVCCVCQAEVPKIYFPSTRLPLPLLSFRPHHYYRPSSRNGLACASPKKRIYHVLSTTPLTAIYNQPNRYIAIQSANSTHSLSHTQPATRPHVQRTNGNGVYVHLYAIHR